MDIKQDSTEVLIDSVKADMDVKGKAKISYNEDWEDPVKVCSQNFRSNCILPYYSSCSFINGWFMILIVHSPGCSSM